MKRLLALALLVGSAAAPLPAYATYPDRPVTAIVSFPAGGATDLVARGLHPVGEGVGAGEALVGVQVENINQTSHCTPPIQLSSEGLSRKARSLLMSLSLI